MQAYVNEIAAHLVDSTGDEQHPARKRVGELAMESDVVFVVSPSRICHCVVLKPGRFAQTQLLQPARQAMAAAGSCGTSLCAE